MVMHLITPHPLFLLIIVLLLSSELISSFLVTIPRAGEQVTGRPRVTVLHCIQSQVSANQRPLLPSPDQSEAGMGAEVAILLSAIVVMFLAPSFSLPGPGWLSLSLSLFPAAELAELTHAQTLLFIDF